MSKTLPGFEMEVPEAFDWTIDELVKKSPYSLKDTVKQLADGQFIIEGKQSGLVQVQLYQDLLIEEGKDTPEFWDAIEELTDKIHNELYWSRNREINQSIY